MNINRKTKMSAPTFLKSFTLLIFMIIPHQVFAETHSTSLMKGASPYVNIHPVGLVVGSLSAELGLAFEEKWAVGLLGSFAQERWLGEGYDGTSYGLSGYHYFSSYATNSIFLKGAFERGHLDMERKSADDGKTVRGIINYNQIKLLAGYHWIWSSGINMNLGGGFNYMMADSNFGEERHIRIGNIKTRVPNGTAMGFIPNVEFSVGVQI